MGTQDGGDGAGIAGKILHLKQHRYGLQGGTSADGDDGGRPGRAP
jgi:hypothetical protein